MKRVLLLLAIIFFTSINVQADSLTITPSLSLEFNIPTGWLLATSPPQRLIAELTEHIKHDAQQKGYKPSEEQLVAAAEKRLKANEAILYNPESNANMTLDFSSLRQGEKPPTKQAIKLSAKYAGQSLEQEKGVRQLTGNSQEEQIDGAWYAYRYRADYLHHEGQMAFTGIIGFAADHWFFFYFSDYRRDAEDQARAEQLLDSLKIISD